MLLQATSSFLFILTFAGLMGGFLAGLFGIGGGLIFVPVLLFVFVMQGIEYSTAMSIAVSTSLATIVFTSLSSLVSHFRLRHIDKKIVLSWGLPVVLGVLFACYLVRPEFGRQLAIVFIGLLLFVSANLIVCWGKKGTSAEVPIYWQLPVAGAIGFVSVLAGVGGGAMTVPALVFMGHNTHKAIGSSAAIGFIISITAGCVLIFKTTPAEAPPGSQGLINYSALLILVITSMICAPFGAKLSSKLDGKLLKKMFAACLLVVALSMYLKIFHFGVT